MFYYLILGSVYFFQFPIYRSVGTGDLAILLLNLYCLVSANISVPREKYVYILGAFFAWLVFGALFINDLDLDLFFNRILRLSNLFLGILLIPNVLVKNRFDLVKMLNAMFIYCLALSSLTIFEVISNETGNFVDFRLVGREFERVSDRPCAVYSEPSIIAIVLLCSNFVIFFSQKAFALKQALPNFVLGLNSVAIIVTSSVAGIIGLVGLFIITVNFNLKKNLLGFGVLILIVFGLNFDKNFKDLALRLSNIVNLEDNSANQRLIGSWSVPFYYLDNIVVGAGTGSEVKFLDEVDLVGEQISMYNAKINNSLAFIFLENGIIGLSLFLFLIASFVNVNRILPAMVIFYCFSHGQYFSSLLWWKVIIFLSIKSLKTRSDGQSG